MWMYGVSVCVCVFKTCAHTKVEFAFCNNNQMWRSHTHTHTQTQRGKSTRATWRRDDDDVRCSGALIRAILHGCLCPHIKRGNKIPRAQRASDCLYLLMLCRDTPVARWRLCWFRVCVCVCTLMFLGAIGGNAFPVNEMLVPIPGIGAQVSRALNKLEFTKKKSGKLYVTSVLGLLFVMLFIKIIREVLASKKYPANSSQ